jgi:hypothetical protein
LPQSFSIPGESRGFFRLFRRYRFQIWQAKTVKTPLKARQRSTLAQGEAVLHCFKHFCKREQALKIPLPVTARGD